MSKQTIHLISTAAGWVVSLFFLTVLAALGGVMLAAAGWWAGIFWGLIRTGWRQGLAIFN